MHCLVAAPIAMLSILISLHVAWGTEITVSATRLFSIPLAVYDQTGFYVGANAGSAWSITDCAFFIGASSDPTSQNSLTCIVGAQLWLSVRTRSQLGGGSRSVLVWNNQS